MSTTAGRKKAPIPDSGKQTSRRNQEKKPGQEELFAASDYSRKTYTPLSETGGDTYNDTTNVKADASDAEAGGEGTGGGGGLQPSSRATRLRAREAAVEAMNFPGKKTEPEADKPKAAGKSGTSDKPKAAEKSKATGKPEADKPATGKPKKVSDTRKQTGTTKRKPAARKPAVRKLSARKAAHRREVLKFLIVSGVLLILAAVIVFLVLRDGTRYSEVIVDTPLGSLSMVEEDTPFPDEVRIFIEPGMQAGEVCRLLEYAKVVRSGGRLQNYLISWGLDTKIRSGLIYLPLSMELEDAAAALVRGYWEHPIVTIYEGFTIAQIDSLLAGIGLARAGEFTEAASAAAEERDLPFVEGFFYPYTYTLASLDNAAVTLAGQMAEQFTRITGPLLENLSVQGRTLEQAVIVASMIQRETANSEEMPYIAGIIWKRLDEGIPLGIDATTRYEIDDWSSPIPKEALETPTPYNTRRKRGLPPTGISNPGFDALQAAAYPRESPYYYYLHDRTGTIHFAVSYADHLENVNTYLR